MAIFLGSSKCAICEQILAEDEKIIGFQSFTNNVKDDLYKLSDSAVHASCLDAHPLKMRIQKLRDAIQKHLTSLPCIVDGSVVGPKDGIWFHFITSDEREELYQYNFKGVSSVNLHAWTGRGRFISLLEKFQREGKYVSYNNFDMIDYLLRLVKE